MKRVLLLAMLFASACSGGTPPGQPTPTPPAPRTAVQSMPPALTPAPDVPGDPRSGWQLISTKGCGGCHTVSGVPGATGVTGPNLTNIALRPTIAGDTIPSSPDMLRRWLLDPPSLKPGTTMPRLGLSDDEARDLVAYLESQAHNAAR